MKKIELEEQKIILLDILKYIDDICRANSLKYSLIGGSLIGAVRHQGIIPWDDDIDIIMTYSDRQKLLKILKSENHKYYKIVDENNSLYPFPKLVDTRTLIIENEIKKIDNYGIYVDIFSYYNMPNNSFIRFIHFKRIEILKKFITGALINDEVYLKEKNILKRIRNNISRKIGIEKINNKYKEELNKYNNKNAKYVASDWPAYGYKHEIQNRKDIERIIDCNFNNQKSMIYQNYDNILRVTFDDYMTPPPPKKQITNHNTEVYWR